MAWELTGNAGTDPTTNFLGTTDNQPLVIKTNGTEQLRVHSSGEGGKGPHPDVEIAGTVTIAGALGIGTDPFIPFTSQPTSLAVGNSITTPWAVTFQHFEPSMAGNGLRPYLRKGWDSSQGDFLYLGATGNRSNTEQMAMVLAGSQGVKFGTGTDDASGLNTELMRLTSAGNLGIGTTSPGAKLEVSGDAQVTGNIAVSGNGNFGNVAVSGNVTVGGDVILTGADCAEEFDVTEAVDIEPGTVMVLDQDGALHQSQLAYDKRVAGVISGAGDYRPGMILDRRQSRDNRAPVALVGKVYCKVDAQYGAIEVGDLLTTSPTPGHAMKADDPFKAFGSVIGKALRPLKVGREMIPILIALQ